MSHQISLTPDAFTMVKFDAAELLAIAESAATAVGVPDDVEITIDVDEALPLPLIASAVDARDREDRRLVLRRVLRDAEVPGGARARSLQDGARRRVPSWP